MSTRFGLVGLTAPYLWAAITDPAGPKPEKPSKVALLALQNMAVSTSVSATYVLHSESGNENKLVQAIERYPRQRG